MDGPWLSICIHSAGAGPLLYQVRGNLNCQVESGHGMSYCVAQFLVHRCQGPSRKAWSCVPTAVGSASLASEECRTARRRAGNNGSPTRGQPGTTPPTVHLHLSSDTTRRPRRCIPGGHASPSTVHDAVAVPRESPENNTGLWLLGCRDNGRDRWIGAACVVLCQGLSLQMLALPRR